MRGWIRGLGLTVAMAGAWMALSAFSPPPPEIKLAVQADSPAAWEVAAMGEMRLDIQNEIKLKVRKVADRKAAGAALEAGRVNVVLADFLWTSAQRGEGADFTFVPHSLATGGLMALPDGKVRSVADLEGATLAVAGEPGDIEYLVLRAFYNARTGGDLTTDATTTFAPAAEVNGQLLGGQADAALDARDFGAPAAVGGATQIASLPDMLKELGASRTPPLLGWVFSEEFADKKPETIKRFLDASFQTRAQLLTDDALWEKIRPAMKIDDDALFIALRDGYRAGIVTGYDESDIEAAKETYALLAKSGAGDLTGGKPDLAEGTFWAGYRK